MPLNFLEFSETYRRKARNRPRERRDIVAQHLGEHYRFGTPGDKDKAVAEAARAGCPGANQATIGGDERLFWSAYQFLAEQGAAREQLRAEALHDEEAVKQGRKTRQRYFGVRCLLADGIETWERVLELAREAEAAEQSAPGESSEELPPRENGSREADALDVDDIVVRAAQNLADSAQTFFCALDQLREDRWSAMRRVAKLVDETESLKTQLARASDALRHAREQTAQAEQRADGRVRELENELENLRSKTLHDLALQEATNSAEGRKLYEIVQNMRAKRAAEEKRGNEQADFPKAMYDGRTVTYEKRFWDDVQNLQQNERERVLTALNRFAKHGERYASLQTSKWQGQPPPGAPAEIFESRASDELRFFWKQDNNTIRIYRAGRHTDFSSSER